MQRQKTIDEIIKLIKEKQENREYGAILISFQNGLINDIDDTIKRKIKVKEE